jgi:hypothetical protein
MHMKTVAGILVLVMLVTLVAVSGSRAQPLPGSSVAFRQCLEQASLSGGRCTSAVSIVAGLEEVGGDRAMDQVGYGDLGQAKGGDLSSPEWPAAVARVIGPIVVAALVRVAENFVDRMFDRYWGGGLFADLPADVSPVIFDPVE